MMQIGKRNVEWSYRTALLNGGNVIVPLGGGGGLLVADGRGIQWLTWFVISELVFDFEIEGATDSAFTNTETIVLQNCPAATPCTPLLLPLPHQGYRVASMLPFIRVRIVDQAAALHAYTRIYVKGYTE